MSSHFLLKLSFLTVTDEKGIEFSFQIMTTKRDCFDSNAEWEQLTNLTLWSNDSTIETGSFDDLKVSKCLSFLFNTSSSIKYTNLMLELYACKNKLNNLNSFETWTSNENSFCNKENHFKKTNFNTVPNVTYENQYA